MFSWSELVPALPEILMLTMACVVLIAGLFTDKSKGGFLVFLSVLTVILAAVLTVKDHTGGAEFTTRLVFNGTFIRDAFGDVLKLTVYLLMIPVFFYAKQYLRQHDTLKGEYCSLLLFATLGIMVMISGYNMIALYLGLELLALSSYALVAYHRDDVKSNEAAMKYFILGALASGMLLYGMSLIYGAVGTMQLDHMSQAIAGQDNDMFLTLGL